MSSTLTQEPASQEVSSPLLKLINAPVPQTEKGKVTSPTVAGSIPAQEHLMQDIDRKLTRWFTSKPNAMQEARNAARKILRNRLGNNHTQQGTSV